MIPGSSSPGRTNRPSDDTVDLAALDASDAWLTAVSHHLAAAADPLAQTLRTWLDHLDADYDHQHPPPTHAVPLPNRRFRSHRSALAAAAALTLLAGTGAAAASPGNPIHGILFGSPAAAAHDDVDHIQRATRLLDDAAALIARGAGHLDSTGRTAAARLLNNAQNQIDQLPPTPTKTRLSTRHSHLESLLAQPPRPEQLTAHDRRAHEHHANHRG